ncbi:hypothetical protein EYZ11_013575 [Aspergillus tanneri]|uniref:CCHC-type domain-containing protein n=1 Tax=Aspergillus tanneri TaxID=1220188 RepID=A0A4S3IXC1_9EURO|nr:hypothetical protein EYZ11_013575 [Aspergillus tanneri]
MARPGQEAGEDEPQNQRRISILPQGTDNPETITKNEFLTKALDDPNGLLEEILRMWNLEQEDKVNEIREVIRQKDAALADLIEGRDKYRDAYAHECLRGRETSVPLSTTETRKSAKIPDPPTLSSGKDPKFEDWMAQMKSKMAANADYYPTEVINITYVQSRLSGRAAEHAAPRFREDSGSQYRTADEIFDHLKSVFHDPNRKQNARRQLRDLRMKPSQKYHNFLAEFLRLAGESQLHQEDHKEELFEKVTEELRNLTTRDFYTTTSFNEYSTARAQAYYTIQVNNEARRKDGKSSTNPGNSASTDATNPKPTVKDTTSASRSGIPQEARIQLMKEGRCFNCKQPGHVARDCPFKKKPELKEVHVEFLPEGVTKETQELKKENPWGKPPA